MDSKTRAQGIEVDAPDGEDEESGTRKVFGPRLAAANVDWRGRDLGTPNDAQVPAYGTFEEGIPRGLCLHFTSRRGARW